MASKRRQCNQKDASSEDAAQQSGEWKGPGKRRRTSQDSEESDQSDDEELHQDKTNKRRKTRMKKEQEKERDTESDGTDQSQTPGFHYNATMGVRIRFLVHFQSPIS